MRSLFSLFQRAHQYQLLTPGERALLKLIEGLVCSALVAALPIVAQALSQGNIQWDTIGRTALAAASVAALLALGKYAKAHNDPLPTPPMPAMPPTALVLSATEGVSDAVAGDSIDITASQPQD